jgi:hypothetical protein
MLNVGFLDQNFLGSVAESFDISLLDVVAPLELLNPLVEIMI